MLSSTLQNSVFPYFTLRSSLQCLRTSSNSVRTELFQDLLYTISLSLLVSLLLAKLFSIASSDSHESSKDTAFEEIKVNELAEVCDFGEIDNVAVFGKAEVAEIENSKEEERESVGCVRSMTEITPLVKTNERCEIEVEEAVKGDVVGGGFTFIGDEEDDWEGIERTELEKEFWAAVAFLASRSNAGRVGLISNEVKMQLYGLYKVSTDGPCRELQPMALKVSARAIWNAWKRVGDITPEDAMEQYIALLSQYVPDWMREDSSEDGKADFLAAKTTEKISSYLEVQPSSEIERELEQLTPCIKGCSVRAVNPNA